MSPSLWRTRPAVILIAYVICAASSPFLSAPLAVAAACPARAPSPQLPQPDAPLPQIKQSREPAPAIRIPRQQAFNTAALDGVVRATQSTAASVATPVPGAQLTLRNLASGQIFKTTANGEGLFRIFPLPPAHYELTVEAAGYSNFNLTDLTIQLNEVVTLEISLASTSTPEARSRLPRLPELGPPPPVNEPAALGSYRVFRHRLDSDPAYIQELAPDYLPPVADVYNSVPNRWALSQPDYRRYPQKGEYMFTRSRWFDP
ncbi:MAG: carboxypeptidase-like regulatory domain-containing protein, partial [Candidatus Acidiferrum sp.]